MDCSSERHHVSQVTFWQTGIHCFLLTQRPNWNIPVLHTSPWTLNHENGLWQPAIPRTSWLYPGHWTTWLHPGQPGYWTVWPHPGQPGHFLQTSPWTLNPEPGPWQPVFTLDSLASPWTLYSLASTWTPGSLVILDYIYEHFVSVTRNEDVSYKNRKVLTQKSFQNLTLNNMILNI